MQLDQKMLNRVLSMSDDQLEQLIRSLAARSGIVPETLGLNPDNIRELRKTLGAATDADLAKYNDVLNNCRRGKN